MNIDRWVNPALIIVDMQNDFVRQDTAMEVPDARTTIPQHLRLISFCREAGIPIIYTRFLAGRGSQEDTWRQLGGFSTDS